MYPTTLQNVAHSCVKHMECRVNEVFQSVSSREVLDWMVKIDLSLFFYLYPLVKQCQKADAVAL